MRSLEPLKCQECGGSIPLAKVHMSLCCYCGEQLKVPKPYLLACDAHLVASSARSEAEPIWATLQKSDYRRSLVVGGLLLFTIPTVLVILANQTEVPRPQMSVIGGFALPGLLPGLFLTIWAGAVRATKKTFQSSMAAQQPMAGQAFPRCRTCSAPLFVEAGALASSCGYCGSDSVVANVKLSQVRAYKTKGLSTLNEATQMLRRRTTSAGLGALLVTALVGGGVAACSWLISKI